MMQCTVVISILLLSLQPTSSFSLSSLSSRVSWARSRQSELQQKNTRFVPLLLAAKDKEDDAQDSIIHLNKETKINKAAEDELVGFQSDMRAQEESTSSVESLSTIKGTSTSDKSITESLQVTQTKAQIKSALQSAQSVFAIIFNGDFGKRGEMFLLLQLFLTYSVAIGHIPLLKNFIQALFGPILLMGGLGTMFSSIQEMRSQNSFTAFATPVSSEEGGTLVNRGMHKFVRHPVYAGNLAAMIGWGIMSNSAMRLWLTFGYYLVVERKVKREEEEMKKEFGKGQNQSYEEYMVDVPDRFIPFKSMNGVLDKFVGKRNAKETGGESLSDVEDIAILEKQRETVHKKKLDTLLNGNQDSKAKNGKNGVVENKTTHGENSLKDSKRNTNGLFS